MKLIENPNRAESMRRHNVGLPLILICHEETWSIMVREIWNPLTAFWDQVGELLPDGPLRFARRR